MTTTPIKLAPGRHEAEGVRAWIIGLVGLIVVGWLINTSPSFKRCVHTEKDERAYHALRENPGIVRGTSVRVELDAVCVEGWTEKYEGAIGAIATVFIAIFTLTLWGATKRLWRSAEDELTEFRNSLSQARDIADEQVAKMGEHVVEAKAAAVAMKTLADAAETQTAVLSQQADILEKQKEIARLQFFAEHRPRLVLKDVYFAQERNYGELTFEISNIGGSGAQIIDGFISIGFVTDPREFKTRPNGELPEIPQKIVDVGEIRTYQLAVHQNIQASVNTSRFHREFPNAARIRNLDVQEPAPAVDLYFFGSIRYADQRGEEFGTIRVCVFRREWDCNSSSFRRTNNPDHEYSD